MSGQIIPTPDYLDEEWFGIVDQIEKQRLGFLALSLTNYDNDSEPQIAAGSVVEISGSIFQFSSDDSIGGTPTSDQINWIMLEVSGSGDSQSVAGTWTTTAPTWNDAKQGWYDAAGTKRYVGKCYYDGTNYLQKMIFSPFRGLSDRNGNEVVALRAETKRNATGWSINDGASQDITVSGFSFIPTAIYAVHGTFGSSGNDPALTFGFGVPTGSAAAALYMVIRNVTFGTGSITISVYNNTGATKYIEEVIITALG
jgi:hypothetical protein